MSALTHKWYAAQVKATPPALTLEQLKELEASFASESDEAVVRYTALLTLAAPAAVVLDAISANRSIAVAFAQQSRAPTSVFWHVFNSRSRSRQAVLRLRSSSVLMQPTSSANLPKAKGPFCPRHVADAVCAIAPLLNERETHDARA